MVAHPSKPTRRSSRQPRAASEAGIASLQADLERARHEYSLRDYDIVERILNELAVNLQPLMQTHSSGELSADGVFLKASMLCLQGRLLSSKGLEADAKEAFAESVRLFERRNVEMEQQKTATRFYTDYAMGLSRIGRTQDAMKLLKQVCDRGTAPPEAFGYLGFAYQQDGRLTEAESAFNKGLQLAPGDPMLLRYLAQTLYDAKKFNEAMPVYCEAALAAWRIEDLQTATQLAQRALELAPTDAQALTIAVNIELARQDPDRAIDIINSVLQHDPQHTWALGLKGYLLRQSGDLNEAIKTLRAVDVRTPDLAWVLVEMAGALHELDPDHDQEALDLLDRAFTLNQDSEALLAQAQILLDREQPDRAVDVLLRAIKINPQSALLQCELGRAFLFSRNFSRAREAFEKALSLEPKSTVALAGKADALRAEGSLDEALVLFRRALRLEPDNEAVFQAMIDVLLEQRRVDEALEEVEIEIQRNPQAAGAYWRKGRILLDQKNLNGAVQAFETAASLNPESPPVIYDLAETLRLLDQYDRAGKAYDDFLRLQPDSPNAIGAKAIYLSEIASFQKASDLLDHAIEKTPGEAWLWGIQGWCLENLGKPFMARARNAYERALSTKKEEKDDLWYRKGLANTLCQLELENEATPHLEKIIIEYKYKTGNDAAILAALGWCHYRLRRYDEGVRLLHASLSVDEDPAVAFDLALTLLASSRSSPASAEYHQAADLASRKHILRQRGLYYVALYDLVDAATEGRIGPDGHAIFELLRHRLAASGIVLTELSWLGHHLPAKSSS